MTNKPLIIGVTGNIATGKSVLGHMLANSGGLEIDADVIANRMIYPSGPAFSQVVSTFGDKILSGDGCISRQKLGEIVFSDEESLKILEGLIHPWVTKAILTRIQKTSQPFVAVEAIKLLESGLADICDTIWVSQASVIHQIERLTKGRNLSSQETLSRIQAQPPQSEKLKRANVVINTEGSFKETWHQINNALNDTIQVNQEQIEPPDSQPDSWRSSHIRAIEDEELEVFWQTCAGQDLENLYSNLGSKIALLLIKKDRLIGLLLWNNWNFTGIPTQWKVRKREKISSELLLNFFETQVKQQEGEIILFSGKFAREYQFNIDNVELTQQKVDDLTYPAWKEAAEKVLQDPEDKIWTKILTQPLEANQYYNLN